MKTITEWKFGETAGRVATYAHLCEKALIEADKAADAGDQPAAHHARTTATYWSTRAFNEANQHELDRRRLVVRMAEGCERFLRNAARAEDNGSLLQAADWRELAEAMSADAFEAMRA